VTDSSAARTRGFRTDVQGLRAIAVGLVLLYHAGIPLFPGGYVGVDVFFVISGFLITTHLLDTIERTGRVSFAQFYARRARRILPASLVVVVLTTLALVAVAPPLALPRMLEDAIATVLYVPNVRFAIQDTDYLADHAASPFQHYWSLGVEEQFYLLWPLVLLVIVLLARRRRAVIGAAVGLIAGASLLACVLVTQVQQPYAFFLLPTRAWELLAGGLIAITVRGHKLRLPAWIAAFGAWAGVGAILLASVSFDDSTIFPGFAALLPVVGTGAVILFGTARPIGGPDLVLGAQPMQYIGLISYSLYLVHWPLLIVGGMALGEGIGDTWWMRALLGIALAVPLAALLHRYIEEPARRAPFLVQRRPRATLLATGAATVVLALSLGAATAWAMVRPIGGGAEAQAAPAAGPVDPPPTATNVPADLKPSLRTVAEDVPAVYADGCHHDTIAISVQDCPYGDPGASVRVALFGDSHSAQWLPALQRLSATGTPMNINSYTKSSCPAVDVTVLVKNVPYTTCDEWRRAVMKKLTADPPDLVVISSYSDYVLVGEPSGRDRREAWSAGLTRTIAALREAGSEVIVIADTPRFETAPAECVSVHLRDVDVCAGERTAVLDAAMTATEKSATMGAHGHFVDLTPYLCDDTSCPIVIFDLLVYRDMNHLTVAFVRYLAPALASALEMGRSEGDAPGH